MDRSRARRRPGPQRRAPAEPPRAGVRRLRVPVPGRHRRRGALDPGPPLQLGGQGVVGAARRRHRPVREGRARALPGAVGVAGGRGVAGAGGQGLGRPRDGRQALRLRLLRARRHLRRAAGAARRAGRDGGRARLAALLEGGRRGAAGDGGRAAGPARAALCVAAPGRPAAPAGDARAGRERRRAALRARRQLGPGDDPGLPGAARLRGARPLAARRPVPARAARALPAHVRRRAGGQRPRGAREAAHRARRGDPRRAPVAGALGAGAGRSRIASAESCVRSSAPPWLTRSRRGAPSWPTSRASARRWRRWPRWRPTTPTRPWSSARRR